MPANPLNITIWDKTFQRLGWLNDPDSVGVTPMHLAIGSATVTVPLDHPKVPLLGAPGNRLCIEYQGKVLMSGPIVNAQGTGGKFNGTITYGIESDERIFWGELGWPEPGNAITNQGINSDILSGPAETVLKHYLGANSARLGLPVTVAPDQGRGTSIKATIRMQPLTDVILPLLTGTGIGLRVVQDAPTDGNGTGLLLDVYETTADPIALTEDAGIVQSWSWSMQAPTATRTVIAGNGTGTSREFAQVVDTAAETLWGFKTEVLTDGSDLDYPALPADVTAKGQATLTAAAASAGLSVQLSETANFTYGKSVNVGDTVTLEVGPGITITDILSQANLTYDPDNGFQASPVIGDRSNDTTKTLVTAITRLGRVVRKLVTAA